MANLVRKADWFVNKNSADFYKVCQVGCRLRLESLCFSVTEWVLLDRKYWIYQWHTLPQVKECYWCWKCYVLHLSICYTISICSSRLFVCKRHMCLWYRINFLSLYLWVMETSGSGKPLELSTSNFYGTFKVSTLRNKKKHEHTYFLWERWIL